MDRGHGFFGFAQNDWDGYGFFDFAFGFAQNDEIRGHGFLGFAGRNAYPLEG